MSETLLNFDID